MSDGIEHRICVNRELNLFTHKHVHDPGSGNLFEYISVILSTVPAQPAGLVQYYADKIRGIGAHRTRFARNSRNH